MTYAFTYDVPINAETYARIRTGLGPEHPDGLVAHLALRIEGGLRYIDVWQSQEERGFVPPEPVHTVLDVIDVWTDRHPS